jgi:hypothetical protein
MRHTHMRLLTALTLTATLVACGSSARTQSGGVRGAVTAGPTCPVERQGSPCPPSPWSGTVRATSSGGETFETSTDAQGAYTLPLPDGTYSVVPVVEGTGPPTASPVPVTVSGGTMQTLDLQVDTGIR